MFSNAVSVKWSSLQKLKLFPKWWWSVAYRNGNVAVPDVDRANSETTVTGHSPMDGAMSKQSAVDVVRSIAWNCSNHVRRICTFKTAMNCNLDSTTCQTWTKIKSNIQLLLKIDYRRSLPMYFKFNGSLNVLRKFSCNEPYQEPELRSTDSSCCKNGQMQITFSCK